MPQTDTTQTQRTPVEPYPPYSAEWIVRLAADRLAGEVCKLVDAHTHDARSAVADALLDYASIRHGDQSPIENVRGAFNELRTTKPRRRFPLVDRIHGVAWVCIRDGTVALERCPKKADVLGVGEWFVPGGKIEHDEGPEGALIRELREEWPGVDLMESASLPIVAGSPIPPGPRGLFLMQPYRIRIDGVIPEMSADGVPVRMVAIEDALRSPVPQVRMMIAAAMGWSVP